MGMIMHNVVTVYDHVVLLGQGDEIDMILTIFEFWVDIMGWDKFTY